MRKVKSVLALLAAFLIWQPFRLLYPDLEVHPIFIYIYALLEIRDNSAKTVNFGKVRIKATILAFRPWPCGMSCWPWRAAPSGSPLWRSRCCSWASC